MKWIDGSIIGPRNELSNEDRVKIYNVIAGSYERDIVDIAQYQAHKMAAKFINVYLKGNGTRLKMYLAKYLRGLLMRFCV